jgi:hypothetical protein
MVSLHLGAGMNRQIFDPPAFSSSVCTTPWASPLQKLSRAALPVLMLILTSGALGGGAATAGTAQADARMMISRLP